MNVSSQSAAQELKAAVWWIDLTEPRVKSAVQAPVFLTNEERTRRDRYRRDEDRLRFAAGRALCKAALARRAGCSIADIQLQIGANGRPFVSQGPTDLFFNLSHSGPIVAAAIAPFPDIGVDTEQERPGVADELCAKVCGPAEQAYLSALPPDARNRRFFQLWTLKEAYMKATGMGFEIDPQSCEFDPSAPPYALRLPGCAPHSWRFAIWPLTPAQSLALCARPPSEQVDFFDAPRRGEEIVMEAIDTEAAAQNGSPQLK